MKLYEQNERYITFLTAVETGEIPEEAIKDTLEALDGEYEEKVENIACLIKCLNAESSAIRDEEKALAERRKHKENTAERLTDYLLGSFRLTGKTKVETSRAVVAIRKTPPAVKIEDEEQFLLDAKLLGDDTYLRYKDPEIDKAKLKEALKNGQTIEGVTLESGERLAIK